MLAIEFPPNTARRVPLALRLTFGAFLATALLSLCACISTPEGVLAVDVQRNVEATAAAANYHTVAESAIQRAELNGNARWLAEHSHSIERAAAKQGGQVSAGFAIEQARGLVSKLSQEAAVSAEDRAALAEADADHASAMRWGAETTKYLESRGELDADFVAAFRRSTRTAAMGAIEKRAAEREAETAARIQRLEGLLVEAGEGRGALEDEIARLRRRQSAATARTNTPTEGR